MYAGFFFFGEGDFPFVFFPLPQGGRGKPRTAGVPRQPR